MRLIRIHSDGSLSLVQYIDNKPIRPYGILSHTWLLAEDEVTFKDMQKGRGLDKKGYAKIAFCALRAQRDGLSHFWVDTCCIDKSQGPELTEAITSMYRWYQEAAKCYVFLRDVRCGTTCRSTLEKAIRRSKWFKRGWTLQELLAPPVVEFYNEEGDFLGDRSSLSKLISAITAIPQSALAGTNLSEFDIETRLSWMKGRRTTKPEDKVYALLGIFGVVMGPIYGEGFEHAFSRLHREIQRPTNVLKENGLRLLQTEGCIKPGDIGFPSCGSFNESVRIDDGLTAPYYIPLQWCETPEEFRDFLIFRFSRDRLPGLAQIERGHIILWDWKETRELTQNSWEFATTHQKALKVSFVMGTFTAPPRKRCMRCRKPRSKGIGHMVVNECQSCQLAVRWVEPDYLPYEPIDSYFSFDTNAYRDYRTKGLLPRSKYQKQKLGIPPSASQDESPAAAVPSIEFVCRRLTMKFEPILNIVFRYLLCRCIMWRGTPSRIIPEMTILRDSVCPRHNTNGVSHRDYQDHSLPCEQDPYFARFGGYNVFWALLDRNFHEIFEELNGASQASELDLVQGHIAYIQNQIERPEWFQDIADSYWFELVNDMRARVTLPSRLEDKYLRIEKKRMERGIEKKPQLLEWNSDEIEQQRKIFSESFMGRELREISTGSWGDKPHWNLRGLST